MGDWAFIFYKQQFSFKLGYPLPGRFWATVAEYNMGVPIFAAFLLFALGLVLMGIEYFKKEA